MTAKPIAGVTRECPRHGKFVGAGFDCPVCEGLDHRTPRPKRQPGEVDSALRERPKSGPVTE